MNTGYSPAAAHAFYRIGTSASWRPALDSVTDVKARWNKLEYYGTDPTQNGYFVYTKLFGTQCTYQYCTTRTNGAGKTEDLIQFFRLSMAKDRLQNKLIYQYPGVQELIPSSIADPDRSGRFITIAQDFNRNVITQVTGPGGSIIDYTYTSQLVGNTHPSTIQKLTGVTRHAANNNLAATVSYDYSVELEANTSSWHAAVNTITDELGHSYSFAYQDNDLVNYVDITNGVQNTLPKTGLPRLVVQVTLPDGNVTQFHTVRNALIRNQMDSDSTSDTTVDGPAGHFAYHFSVPFVESYPPPGQNANIPAPFHDTTVTFTRLDITSGQDTASGVGTETYTFNPFAGMALATAMDMSGNSSSFTYVGGLDDPVIETDAMGHTKYYSYDFITRVMSSMTDQTGVVTSYDIQPNTGLKLSETVTDANGVSKRHSTYQYNHTTFKGFMTQSSVDADPLDPAPPTVTTYALGSGNSGWTQVTETTPTASGPVVTTTQHNLAGSKIAVTDPRGKTTSFQYDVLQRLSRVTHPGGTHKDLAYDAHGNLICETHENGVSTFHEYDVLNRRTKTTVDLNGNGIADASYTTITPGQTSVSYDGDIVTTATYNGRNQVLKQTDARGKITCHHYDAVGRLLKMDDGGLVTTMEYGDNSGGSVFDSSGFKPTRITDPRGTVTTRVYDKMYRTRSQTVSADSINSDGSISTISATTSTRYDAAGRPTRVKDALGRKTHSLYDVFGQILQVTHPDGTSVSTAYTHHGKPWKVVDELGNTTTTDFDEAGRAVMTHAPAIDGVSVTHTMLYDAAGNLTRLTDPLGQATDTTYDDLNRPVLVQAPAVWNARTGKTARPTTQTTYDALGQVLTVTDPLGNVTTKFYDNAGRNWKVVAPVPEPGMAAPTIITTFDAGGLALTVTNALNQTVTNTYDIHGRLTQTKDAANISNSFEYDAVGNRTSVTDGLQNTGGVSHTTNFTYDYLNRLTSQTFANGDAWSYVYNAVQKVSQTSPNGITTSYTYDARDHVLTMSAPVHGSTPALGRSFVYDLGGRLLSVTETGNAAANVAYSYDAMGRMTSETSNGIVHTYDYDLAGNRVLASYGTGTTVQTSYDALHRPEIISEGGRETWYGYDLAGHAVALAAGNGQMSHNTYDNLGRLVGRTLYTTNAMNEVQAQFTWAHDALGNVTSQNEIWPSSIGGAANTRSTAMTYDSANRLLSETVTDSSATGQTTTWYGYDAANNRLQKTVTGGTDPGVWNYTYNNVNQLTGWEQLSSTGVQLKHATLAYDGSGNRTSQIISGSAGSGINPAPAASGTTTYQWDAQDRLASVTLPDGTQHAYDYDYRTRRIGTHKFVSAVQQAMTAIVFAGGLSVAEFDTTTDSLPAAPSVEYTRGPDMGGGVGGMLYSLRSGSSTTVPVVKYSLSNGRGDIVAQADSSAALTWTASYEAYGRRTAETGINQDKQRGNSKDEDPTGLLNEGFRYRDLDTGVWLNRDPIGESGGINLYGMVGNDPVNRYDVLGNYAVSAKDAKCTLLLYIGHSSFSIPPQVNQWLNFRNKLSSADKKKFPAFFVQTGCNSTLNIYPRACY